MMFQSSKKRLVAVCGVAVVLTAACSSLKTPATASVAVSAAAVENATSAGGAEFAPIEMNAAREKMARAEQSDQAAWRARGDAADAQRQTQMAQDDAAHNQDLSERRV